MENNLSGLVTELNGLLRRVGEILTEVEALLPTHERIKFVKYLSAPSSSVISRLLKLDGAPPDEELHHPAEERHAAFDDHNANASRIPNHREDVESPAYDERNPTTYNDRERNGTAVALDDCHRASVPLNHHEQETAMSNGHERAIIPRGIDPIGSGFGRRSRNDPTTNNPDRRSNLYCQPRMQDRLHKALIENNGEPQNFLRSVNCGGSEGASGLTGAFFRLQQKCQDIQNDETRELYLQFYSLHRRLELRNIFLLAKYYGYHSGKRWYRNACHQLAAKIKSKHLSWDTEETYSLLEEYVRLGCAYDRWAEELGGPGSLLILPLSVTEYQYTGREYSSFFSQAVDSLRKFKIKDIIKEKGLDVLADKICTGLWTAAQCSNEITERSGTEPTPRNKRKRQHGKKKGKKEKFIPRKLPRKGVNDTESALVETPSQGLGPGISEGSEQNSVTMILDGGDSGSLSENVPETTALFVPGKKLYSTSSIDAPTLLPGGDAEFHNSTDIASLFPGGDAEFPDSIDITSLLPGGDAGFSDSIDITSLFPGGDAEFPDSIDITSLLPGGDAGFSDSIDITSLFPGGDAEFPDSIDITSLLPGGDAEFPNSIDITSLLPGGDAEFPSSADIASLCPGRDAEFSNSIGITSLFPGGEAEFPNSTGAASLLSRGDAEPPGPADTMADSPHEIGSNSRPDMMAPVTGPSIQPRNP